VKEALLAPMRVRPSRDRRIVRPGGAYRPYGMKTLNRFPASQAFGAANLREAPRCPGSTTLRAEKSLANATH
jgi:hypothetical protein